MTDFLGKAGQPALELRSTDFT